MENLSADTLVGLRVVSAEALDVSTQKGLVNYLLSQKFAKTTMRDGQVTYAKRGAFKKILATLLTQWSATTKEVSGYSWYWELTNKADPSLNLWLNASLNAGSPDPVDLRISWKVAQFKSVDAINIYNITKQHPAWRYWTEYLDINYVSKGLRPTPKDKKDDSVKVVNDYMKELSLTPDQLKGIIKKRATRASLILATKESTAMTSTVNAANGPDFFKWADEMEADLRLTIADIQSKRKLANMLQNLTKTAPTIAGGEHPRVTLKPADPLAYAAGVQKHFEKMGFVFSVTGPKSTYGKARKFLGLTDLEVWIDVISGGKVTIGIE